MAQPLRIQPFNFYSLRDFSLPANAQHIQPAFMPIQEAIVPEPELPPPPPPPPTFSEAEVERIREIARAEGHAQGIQEGIEKARHEDANRDALLISQLQQFCAQLVKLREEHATTLHTRKAEAVQLATSVAGMIATRALQQDPSAIAEDLIQSCLPLLMDEPKLTLTAHPAITEALKYKLAPLLQASQYEGLVNIEPSAAFNMTECKLAWTQGEATRSQENVWQTILERILPAGINQHMPTLQQFSDMLPSTPAPQEQPMAAPLEPDAVLPEIAAHINHTIESAEATSSSVPRDLYTEPSDLAASAPEYRIAREDENPIVHDILHTIEEVEQEQEQKKNRNNKPQPE